MDKRISLISEESLLCEVIVVLTDSQREKLENGQLREKIENIAKDMKLCWDVEKRGNISITAIGRECGPVVGSEIIHQIEIDATNFMGAVDKIELPVNEDVIHFDDNTKLDFVKQLLTDLNLPKEDEDSVIGAQILRYGPKNVPFPLPWGKMSHNLLKEMCELYIEKYGNK